MPFTPADLKRTVGQNNMGGLLSKAYWVAVDDIDFTTPLVLSAVNKLDFAGPIVLKAAKKFIELYSTPAKNKLDDASVGEVDGMSKENSYEFFHPGNAKEVAEWEAYALNTPCVIIIPETNGVKRVLGLMAPDFINSTEINTDLNAHLMTASGSSGAARADLKGKTFKFIHNAPHAPLYYTGTIDVTG